MPPRKKASAAPPPLTDDEVATLRDRVKAGEKPRVIVRAASAAVPAGTRGNIVRVGNPSEGEFIVVRLGRDEVPFAPGELAVATRGKNGAVASAPAATTTTSRRPARGSTGNGDEASRPVKRSETARPAPVRPRKPTTATAAASTRATKRTAAARRTPPPLTVTLRFADGQWSVEAARGARRLSKPSTVRPGAVKAFADLVDEPQLRDALTETVESCRAVVEERAAALREQLHATEAALREYEARRR